MSQVQPEYRVLPPRIATTWWLQKSSYFVFILREMSCVFVAWSVIYLLMLIQAVSQGDAGYEAFLTWSGTSPVVLVNLVTLLFLLFHAVTFFAATPQAMVVKVGPNRVPGGAILAGHYVGLVAVSLVVCWLLGV
jgi:fumarate reductase subunit C